MLSVLFMASKNMENTEKKKNRKKWKIHQKYGNTEIINQAKSR